MTSPDRESLPGYLRKRMQEKDIRSLRELARISGIGPQTASRLLAGEGIPDEVTLRRVADALVVPLPQLRELAGRPRGELTPFVLPARADQLSEGQRAVVLSVVDALLDASSGREQPVAEGEALRLVGRLRDPDGPTPRGRSAHTE